MHLKHGALHTVHCKKRFAVFPSPAGMSLTKPSLAGNNLIIPVLGEFGKWHPGWGRENREPFFTVYTVHFICIPHSWKEWLTLSSSYSTHAVRTAKIFSILHFHSAFSQAGQIFQRQFSRRPTLSTLGSNPLLFLRACTAKKSRQEYKLHRGPAYCNSCLTVGHMLPTISVKPHVQ